MVSTLQSGIKKAGNKEHRVRAVLGPYYGPHHACRLDRPFRPARPSIPVQLRSWAYPLTSRPPPVTTTSSASFPPHASVPSVSRRAKLLSAAPRKPLAPSTSSANQPPRYSARPRPSSHSTALHNPSTSKEKYVPQVGEPEAIEFIELVKNASRQVDENSNKK